jgi:hypothetical protein
MTTSFADGKKDKYQLGELYGDMQTFTRIMNWFIVLIILGLVSGVFIVLSTNDIFAAIMTGVGVLPALACLFLVRRKTSNWRHCCWLPY